MDNHKTIILRHRRENLKKCSLRGLESRDDFAFYAYPKHPLPPLDGYLLLALDAPVLSRPDAHLGIFLIDGGWKHCEAMYKSLKEPRQFQMRSLPPSLVTAYPRRQDDCADPKRGLASIEALFAAYLILGKDTEGLLDGYRWKKEFLEKNNEILSCY